VTRADPTLLVVDDVEYVTTATACERLAPDVNPQTLRNWRQRGLIDVARDPDGNPIRLPSPSGPQNVYRWADVKEAEHATRVSRHGRRRRLA
jgi:hypothetical protein